MDKILNIASSSHISDKRNAIKFQQRPVLKQSVDSVSFTGRNTESKNLVSRIVDFFSDKNDAISAQQKAQSVATIWKFGDGVTPEDANCELAQKLRAMTYLRDTRDYTNVVTDMYDEVAIKTIIKYDKQDPEFAKKMADVLKYSHYSNVEQLELIASRLKENPEFVKGIYDTNFQDPRQLAMILESYDINPKFVSQIMDLKSQDGYKKYGAYDISSMVQALEDTDEKKVLKYAADSRIDLCADDVIQLAKIDAKNAQEIDDLIYFVKSNNLQKDARLARISSLLSPYMEDKEATKGLMKLGVVRDDLIKQYAPTFNDIPKFISTILFKNHQDSRMGFTISEVVPYAYKFKQYEEQIMKTAGQEFENLSASQLKSLIDRVEQHTKQIAKIIQGAV